jgi:glycosyltransferase involved in cell wall biosynthesis
VRALDSVLSQTLQPKEILLIDDASGDDSLDLLLDLERLHSPLLRVIALTKNSGPGVARNAGWDVATQPWLAFLDADDAWHPRKLEIQWRWLNAHPEVAICGHGTKLVPYDNTEYPVELSPRATSLNLMKMLVSNRLPTRSVMLRRDLSFRFGGREVTEDYLLWLQIISAGVPAWRLETPLACSFRPEFSLGGYSGQLWTHEKRELSALRGLRSSGQLSWLAWAASSSWSLVKYLRRRWLIGNKS